MGVEFKTDVDLCSGVEWGGVRGRFGFGGLRGCLVGVRVCFILVFWLVFVFE